MAGKITITYEMSLHNNDDKETVFDNVIDPAQTYRIIENRHCDCGAPNTKKLVALVFDKATADKIQGLIS